MDKTWDEQMEKRKPFTVDEPKTVDDCVCYRGHVEGCSKFNPLQALHNLQSSIKSLEQLIDDGFAISIGKLRPDCYFIFIKHPTQEEDFEGETLEQAINELDQWVSHCSQGQ